MPLSRSFRPMSLALALMGASVVAWAQPQPQQPAPAQNPPKPRPHAQRNPQGLSESVRRAERSGQVLSAEQVQYDGRDVNRVKIVDDRGRVRVYWDDPAARRQGQDQAPKRGKDQRDAQPTDGSRTRDDDDGDPTL